jgi:hypothetical protein
MSRQQALMVTSARLAIVAAQQLEIETLRGRAPAPDSSGQVAPAIQKLASYLEALDMGHVVERSELRGLLEQLRGLTEAAAP